MPEDALELESRRKIFQYISKNPGTHLRRMESETDFALGQLEYHLDYLVREELISFSDDGFRKHYFVSAEISHSDKPILSLLRQKVPRRIIVLVLLNPGISFQELTDELGISKSTLSFHMKKLTGQNIVTREKDGRQSIFRIEEENRIAKLILAYRESFVDRMVDRFASAWLDLE